MKWELPGGKVDFGETMEEALKREFLEETGREIEVVKLLPYAGVNYWDYAWGKQQTLCFVFLCKLVKDGKPKVMDHHVAEIKWVPIGEVKNLSCLPDLEKIVEIVSGS
ncbi:MAG TPA: NUDIX hydrolase [Patescibacteria group bacterium]|nr:NUDIX hydrolase [Patescibacteria group bacterium]